MFLPALCLSGYRQLGGLSMTANPGDVFELSADEVGGESADKGPRPHIVLTRPESIVNAVTLVYCSTEDTEARLTPPPKFMAVRNDSAEGRLAGFYSRRPFTYLYPNRLVLATAEDLPSESKIGIIPDLLTELRDEALPRALGIGKGSTREAGPAAGSPRGVIAELTPLGQKDVGPRYVLVVSEPAYARRGNFWNVIPIISRGNLRPQEPDFTVSGDLEWLITLPGMSGDALLLVRMLRAIYRHEYVQAPHPGADGETMGRLDRALARHFGAHAWF